MPGEGHSQLPFPPQTPILGQAIKIRFLNGEAEIETTVVQREVRWFHGLHRESKPLRKIILFVQHGLLEKYPEEQGVWSYHSSNQERAVELFPLD